MPLCARAGHQGLVLRGGLAAFPLAIRRVRVFRWFSAVLEAGKENVLVLAVVGVEVKACVRWGGSGRGP